MEISYEEDLYEDFLKTPSQEMMYPRLLEEALLGVMIPLGVIPFLTNP